MKDSFKAMAQRMVNADESFINSVMDQFGFTESEAATILNVYAQEKAIKLDVAIGTWRLTHGALWDKEIMLRALEIA